VFTARYALSPYIKQMRFVFKGLNRNSRCTASYDAIIAQSDYLTRTPTATAALSASVTHWRHFDDTHVVSLHEVVLADDTHRLVFRTVQLQGAH
jgi:hypothetical protein